MNEDCLENNNSRWWSGAGRRFVGCLRTLLGFFALSHTHTKRAFVWLGNCFFCYSVRWVGWYGEGLDGQGWYGMDEMHGVWLGFLSFFFFFPSPTTFPSDRRKQGNPQSLVTTLMAMGMMVIIACVAEYIAVVGCSRWLKLKRNPASPLSVRAASLTKRKNPDLNAGSLHFLLSRDTLY